MTIPANAPKLQLADGRMIAVALTYQPFVGKFLAVFDQQPDGSWVTLSGSGQQNAILDPNQFDASVVAAGGELKWLQTIGIPQINAILASNYVVDPTTVSSIITTMMAGTHMSVKNNVPGFY